MINPVRLRREYREFRMYNQYTYPVLFFFIGLIKPVAIVCIAIVALLALLPYGTRLMQYGESIVAQPAGLAKSAILKEQLAPLKIVKTTIADTTKEKKLIDSPVTTIATTESGVTPTDVGSIEDVRPIERDIRGAEWVMSRKPGRFTVQFATSPDRALLVEFAGLFTPQETLAIYPFKKTPTERPVYGLASGVYPSLESAQKAIREMPEGVREFEPWIRPLKALQKEIQKYKSS